MRNILLVCLALFLADCYSHVQVKPRSFSDASVSVEAYRHRAGEFLQIDLLFKNKTNYAMRMQVECQWFASEDGESLSKPEVTVLNIEPWEEAWHTRKTLAGTSGYYWDCQYGYKTCQ